MLMCHQETIHSLTATKTTTAATTCLSADFSKWTQVILSFSPAFVLVVCYVNYPLVFSTFYNCFITVMRQKTKYISDSFLADTV